MSTLSTAAAAPASPAIVPDLARNGPVWVLIAVFLGLALSGAMAQHRAAGAETMPLPASPAAVYSSLILMQWGLAFYVWKVGLRRSGASLRALVGGRWGSLADVAVDAGIGLLTWAACSAMSLAWQAWSGPDPAASVQSLLPRHPHEVALWILLSASAGFSEELVFRGYLQERFSAWTGSATLGVLLQAALFGVAHGYQGIRRCLRIAVYGLLFGVLARTRRSLRPGMIAHAWTDVASGLLRI